MSLKKLLNYICIIMNIGFEAKRVYQNKTGLGNATRSIVECLLQYFPQHHYHLFAPKITDLFTASLQITTHTPQGFLNKKMPFVWRSKTVITDIIKNKIDVYIGLAAELPFGIHQLKITKAVVVYDLIFERYPKQYNAIDVITYRTKTKYACKVANVILVISMQTKNDLIQFYNIDSNKIKVIHLTCNEIFNNIITTKHIEDIKQKYNLPPQYFVSVGSIIERKNLLKICEAYLHLPNNFPPLVVIGAGKNYYATQVQNFIKQHNIAHKIIFLNHSPQANLPEYKNSIDLPAIYKGSEAVIYISDFEGFGLPILEAMASGVAVISSNKSCLPEVGGDAVLYTDTEATEIAKTMQKIFNNRELKNNLIKKGLQRAEIFSEKILANNIMQALQL